MLSLICGVRNRVKNLRKSLRTWLKCPEIDEIIIVDWGSSLPIKFSNIPKVTVVRVESDRWILTHALNVAARFAKGDQICKCDADYMLHPEFFRQHYLKPNTFIAGSSIGAKINNEHYLTGFVYLWKNDFFKINGYNERIVTYGYDDTDLVHRLKSAGLQERRTNNDYIFHLPHKMVRHKPIIQNKLLTEKHPWTTKDKMLQMEAIQIDDRYWSVKLKD